MGRALLIAVAVVVILAPGAGTQGGGVDVRALLDTYEQGRYDDAVAKATALSDLGPFRLRFVQDTPVWINAAPATIDRRRAAAAAFLLEVTGARLESDWGRFSDLIEWMCVQLRTAGTPTEFERAWHSASHALAGRARVRQWMLGLTPRLAHQKPAPEHKLQPNERPPAMHLMHALERFPGDPHFQLSRVVAWTWGRDSEPIRNVETRVRGEQYDRARLRRTPQLEAVTALEPLTAIPEVAAEAWVRLGLVHFSVSDFSSALRAFESAQPIAVETSMKYLAFFNAGRALEGLQRQDDAIRAYQRALEVVPDAESATVALTSLQFMRDEREAAVTAIDRVFNRKPGPPDPGRMIGYGSFIRWDALKASMRSAIPATKAVPR